jgi:hypothetical protein
MVDPNRIAEIVNLLAEATRRARELGVEDRKTGVAWSECPFDFSTHQLREAWSYGYSDQEEKDHKALKG